MTSAANWVVVLLILGFGSGGEEEGQGGQISDKVYEDGFGTEKQFSFTIVVTLLVSIFTLVFISCFRFLLATQLLLLLLHLPLKQVLSTYV